MPEPLTRPEGKILDVERLRGWAIASVFFTHLELSAGLFRRSGWTPSGSRSGWASSCFL